MRLSLNPAHCIGRCHGPYQKLCGALLSYAGRAFFQVLRPSPVGLDKLVVDVQ